MSPVVHPSATHQALLRQCIEQTSGAVLELGCGEHSTPFIYQVIVGGINCNRVHHKFDSMLEWANRYNAEYMPDWSRLSLAIRYSVALVDCHPMESRGPLVEIIRPFVDYIVAHDTEPDSRMAYRWDVVRPFRYTHIDDSQGPWTTVFSELELGFLI